MFGFSRIGFVAVPIALVLAGCVGIPEGQPAPPNDAETLDEGCDPEALSPAAWPPEERAEFAVSPGEGHSEDPHTDLSTKGMVVGSTGPLAIRAGLKALENCGTALDAVLTTAMAQITLAAGSWVSFAGVSSLLYYEAATGEVSAVNGNWNAMLRSDAPPSLAHAAVPSGRSVLVHGFMDAAGVAHERWGRLPWSSIFGPAIWVADEGMTVDASFANQLASRYPYLVRTPEGREIFLKSDGTPYREGDKFRQPQLAGTLRAVAEDGHRYMYGGPWAEEWVRLVNREGGVATLEDLARYEALVQPPLRGPVRGVTFTGPPEPDTIGGAMRGALQAVERANLQAVGPPYATSRALYEELRIWRDSGAARESAPLGHSDCVVAMDQEGNIAALTHSINAVLWGSTGIFVDGISIADSGSIQEGAVARAGPGGRVETPMVPTMLLNSDGRPILATSAIGSGLQELTFTRLVDVLEYGQPLADAVWNPSFHWGPLAILGEYDPVVLAGVRAMGEPIPELPEAAMATRGYIVALQIDPASGEIVGAFGGDLGGRAEGQD